MTSHRLFPAVPLLLPVMAHAAEAGPSPWLGLFKVSLSLGIIIVAIFVVLGFVRRVMLTGMPGGAQPLLRLRSGIMVGQRERIVIVEVQDTWLVVGVTGTQMTLLHTLPRGEEPPPAAPSRVAQHWLEVWRKVQAGGKSQ